jgi:hypothetical protein
MLCPDPTQQRGLIEVRDNLRARIEEAQDGSARSKGYA